MKRFIAEVIALLLLVVGLGFYRGWFTLSSSDTDKGGNKVNVNLAMDPDKVKADAEAVKEKATELTGQATEGASEPGNQSKDSK